MTIQMFSGLKTRTRTAALALLFGLAAAFAASPLLAQDSGATADAPASIEEPSPVADAAPADAPPPLPADAAMDGAVEAAVEAEAADAGAEAVAFDSGNVAWMLTSTLLVLLMVVPGLALFYGGMVRSKNVLSVLMQVLVVFSVVILVWVTYGYSAAFTEGNAFFGSFTEKAFLKGITASTEASGLPEFLFIVFQSTFAGITTALIVGSFAERIKFAAVLLFSVIWVTFAYLPMVHMVWSGGFLAHKGVLDFAGGTVVHINAGIAGLVGAYFLGRRLGFGREALKPHNVPFTFIGASLLWVGWFGFNAGSAGAANGAAGMAMAVTQIATATAALTWMFVEWATRGKPSVLGIISGAVGGLVAVTPASGFITPTGALLLGLAAGACCYWGATALKIRAGYDDSLDAFGVHGVGGIVGALLTGVFAAEAVGGTPGLLEGNPGQVLIQLEGIVGTIAWCAIGTYVILKLVDATIGLRVTSEIEINGLDLSLHGETVQ